ncbi:Ataxin-1 [Holothuria leucospilota]|uniref:Ataxin-1 n=1 Tax=Holothuria leucospilota TaxID=206669 RepID=A0A9Q1HER4_HOLLE|nr:Ataxin-1 [Holothuria leucospilota]
MGNAVTTSSQPRSTQASQISTTIAESVRVSLSQRSHDDREGCFSRDVNSNFPQDADSSKKSNTPLSPTHNVSDSGLVSVEIPQTLSTSDRKHAQFGLQSTLLPEDSTPACTMTPVTLPAHHSTVPSAVVTPSVSTGVTFAPYVGAYPSSLTLPAFPNYIPVGTQLTRYPAVESYSAMLANMGTQLQLAQGQSHLMHQSYVPGGYITLASPHVSLPPVLIPAASQDMGRERGVPVIAKTSAHVTQGGQQSPASPHQGQLSFRPHHELAHSKGDHTQHTIANRMPGVHNLYHDTHTVKVGGTYVPAVSNSTESSLQRRTIEGIRPSVSHELNQAQLSSLDAVLGKTTYTQHASAPGGIKIELPPPTIGIHIGARPSNLAHHNMAIVPPLIPKSNVHIESGESSKVVQSSLSAPMTCIGETFASGVTTPYIHRPSMRHVSSGSHVQSASSVPPFDQFSHSKTPSTFPFSSIKQSEEHERTLDERGNNVTTTSSWSANPPEQGLLPTFHVKSEQIPADQRPEEDQLDQRTRQRHPSNQSEKQGVQSSRPILTAQAPSPMANVPSYFTRGSIIQLANGHLKRVEELQTEDFVSSAHSTDGLKIDSSTVSRIEEDNERNVANISFLVGEHNAQFSCEAVMQSKEPPPLPARKVAEVWGYAHIRRMGMLDGGPKSSCYTLFPNVITAFIGVTLEARLDHPFFVYGQGWSSVSPECSQKCYALNCHALAVGDVCVSLTVVEKAPPPSPDCRKTPSSDLASVSSRQEISSPERKRQRFQETRTTHVEESIDDGKFAPAVSVKASTENRSLSQEQRSMSVIHEKTSEAEEMKTDMNKNVISGDPYANGNKMLTQKEASHERWNQPPKRRWSDPIKSSQSGAGQTKDPLPNPPHPSSLAKLTEEQLSDTRTESGT